MTSKKRPSATNVASLLLSNAENESLFNIIGRGCITLASCVVQLYLAHQSDGHHWSKQYCGIVCFIKDNPTRSYFIRIYDIKKGQHVWEQELYNHFMYKTPREYFHTFEANDSVAGLNFASQDEANMFKNAITKKLHERMSRREKKVSTAPADRPVLPPPPATAKASLMPITDVSSKTGTSDGKKSKKDKDKGKRLSKADIGTPSDFRHVTHLGFDAGKGLDTNNVDPDMKELFDMVGVKDDTDKETIDFIYDFVNKSGGIEAVREEIKKERPLPPPPPSVSIGGNRPLPSAPNRHMPKMLTPAPPAPSNQAAMPGSGGSVTSRPPPMPPQHFRGAPPHPPSQGRSGQPLPPPPPPGLPSASPAPPPPPPPPPILDNEVGHAPSAGMNRGALLSAIQSGAKLRPAVEKSTAGQTATRPVDSRGELLNAIRHGTGLKKVDSNSCESKPVDSQPEAPHGLVGSLARALASRRNLCVDSDSESGSDDNDVDEDDEWDD